MSWVERLSLGAKSQEYETQFPLYDSRLIHQAASSLALPPALSDQPEQAEPHTAPLHPGPNGSSRRSPAVGSNSNPVHHIHPAHTRSQPRSTTAAEAILAAGAHQSLSPASSLRGQRKETLSPRQWAKPLENLACVCVMRTCGSHDFKSMTTSSQPYSSHALTRQKCTCNSFPGNKI